RVEEERRDGEDRHGDPEAEHDAPRDAVAVPDTGNARAAAADPGHAEHARDDSERERRPDQHVPPERADPVRRTRVRRQRVLLRSAPGEDECGCPERYDPHSRQAIPRCSTFGPATRGGRRYSSGSSRSSRPTWRRSTTASPSTWL